MSVLQTRLGYGRTAVVELDTFTRILKGQFYDDEEVRCIRPTDYTNGFEYVGVAILGSLTNDPVWQCVRKEYFGNTRRIQYRLGVIWNNVQQGWA